MLGNAGQCLAMLGNAGQCLAKLGYKNAMNDLENIRSITKFWDESNKEKICSHCWIGIYPAAKNLSRFTRPWNCTIIITYCSHNCTSFLRECSTFFHARWNTYNVMSWRNCKLWDNFSSLNILPLEKCLLINSFLCRVH